MSPAYPLRFTLGITLLAFVFTACTGGIANTPRTSVPTELAQQWYSGSVSPIGFFNPGTGQWASPSGEGLMFTFTSDGRFTNGFLANNSLYGCTVSFMVYLEGTLTVQGKSLTLYPNWGHKKFEAPCAPSNNENRRMRPDEVKTFEGQYLWEVGTDQGDPNTILLAISNPDGRPWTTLRLLQ